MRVGFFKGGPLDGEPCRSSSRDVYPLETTGRSSDRETGFYFRTGDEPVWDWIPFKFGNGMLDAKLKELGL